MALVKDIMTRKVLTIDPNAKLDDVAADLTKSGISGAPVKDEAGHVIGILSKSDLADSHRFGDDTARTPAQDAMTPVLFATKDSDSVHFAARRMVQTGAHRLVVIDDAEALVGIVTPMDVLKALLDGRVTADDFTSS